MVQSSLKHFFMHTYNLLSHFIYNIIIVLLRFCKLILHPKFMQLFWKKDKEVTYGNLNHHALKTCPFPVTWSTRIATSTFTLMIPSLFLFLTILNLCSVVEKIEVEPTSPEPPSPNQSQLEKSILHFLKFFTEILWLFHRLSISIASCRW